MPAPTLLRRFFDLAICIAVAVGMIASTAVSLTGPLVVLFGGLLVLFVPGYTLTCALWGSESDLTAADRVAFSVGLSVSLSVFTLLALSEFGVGIFPLTVAVALGYTSLAFSILALSLRWVKHQGVPADFVEAFKSSRTAVGSDRAFWAVVAVLLVAAAVLVSLILTVPQPPLTTQFYLLGPDGTTSTLPSTFAANQTVSILVGVHNGLSGSVPFTVSLCLLPANGTCAQSPVPVANWSSPLSLAPNGTYALNLTVPSETTTQASLAFSVTVAGDYVLSFALDGGGVHRELRLPLAVVP